MLRVTTAVFKFDVRSLSLAHSARRAIHHHHSHTLKPSFMVTDSDAQSLSA